VQFLLLAAHAQTLYSSGAAFKAVAQEQSSRALEPCLLVSNLSVGHRSFPCHAVKRRVLQLTFSGAFLLLWLSLQDLSDQNKQLMLQLAEASDAQNSLK
jgi:hypothetical protein